MVKKNNNPKVISLHDVCRPPEPKKSKVFVYVQTLFKDALKGCSNLISELQDENLSIMDAEILKAQLYGFGYVKSNEHARANRKITINEFKMSLLHANFNLIIWVAKKLKIYD